jgi:MFS family permease
MKSTPIHRTVLLTGLTSFFTDVSSEMIYPLLQAFIGTILAARGAFIGPALGIIEGVAESTASLVKVFSGYYSDRFRKRKGPAIAGYGLSTVAKGLLLLASVSWLFVLISRFADRVGKGVRGAPRDALIADSVAPEVRGSAFGLQRAMDFAGATLGVLILYLLSLRFIDHATGTIKNIGGFYRVFAASIVPAALGVVFLFFIKEPQSAAGAGKTPPRPNLDLRRYDGNLKGFFLVQALFTLGNSSNQFLLLRSMNLGFALPTVVLMYLVYNLSSTVFSQGFGSLADRIGFKKVLMAGYALYGIVYAAFGLAPHGSPLLWGLWLLYGVYAAMTEGMEKAFVARIAPGESRATALGFSYTIVGIGLLPASVIAGLLFSVHPAAPFLFGAATTLLTLAVFAIAVHEKKAPGAKTPRTPFPASA